MDRRKKILFLITKTNWGGAQRYAYDLATNLPRDRFEVAVAASGGDGALFTKLRTAGIRTISVPGLQKDVGMASEWRALLHIFRLLKKEQPDVVHLNSSKAGALGSLAVFFYKFFRVSGFGFRVLTIFTAHGWGFHEDRSRLARAAIFFVSWLASLFQDKIIVLDTADFAAAQRFIPQRKLALIHNGIKKIDFYARADARAFLAKKIARPITDDTILIGAVAELTKNKGLRYLIDALHLIRRHASHITHRDATPLIRTNKGQTEAKSRRVLSYIIGDGEEKENLQKHIDALGLNDSVFLAGFIPDASRYLAALDIFVLPSLKEGLPYVVMEAMSAGLAVIATRVGGIPDLITDGQNGILVEAKNPRAMADAIYALMRDPETPASRGLGMRAQKTIETTFSFSAMMQYTIALYCHAAPPLE